MRPAARCTASCSSGCSSRSQRLFHWAGVMPRDSQRPQTVGATTYSRQRMGSPVSLRMGLSSKVLGPVSTRSVATTVLRMEAK